MDFRETLKRYHISPLQYDDGVELNEIDYNSLFVILQKYFFAKNMLDSSRVPQIPDNLKHKAEVRCKKALLAPDLEDLMDILMEQEGGNVL